MIKESFDTAALYWAWLLLQLPCAQARSISVPERGRHLALFASALPPNTTAGVHRPLSFLRYGGKLGWEIDAFRDEVPPSHAAHGQELLKGLPATVRIHELKQWRGTPSFRLTPAIDGGFSRALFNARDAIEKLRVAPPSIVLASGPPFNVFLTAYYVARRFRAKLVLDYRDEWTQCPFDFVQKDGANAFWEKFCLTRADALFFTTASHISNQVAKFPMLSREKIHHISNGWEPADFPDPGQMLNRAAPSQGERVNLVHAGALADHTPPDAFLAAVKDLFLRYPVWQRRLLLTFVGRRSPAANAAIEAFPFRSNISLIDHVGKRESNRLMREADLLLLIAVPALERYLPSKLFDYLASRRPVLVHGHAGEASRLVESLRVGVVSASTNGAELHECLSRLINSDPIANEADVAAWLDCHRRDVLAERAFTILEDLRQRVA